MARYTKVLKSLAHNAVGNRRIQAAAPPAGGDGDITGVTAGTNLNGGGSSGAVTLNLDTNITGNIAFDTSTLYVDASNDRVGIGTTTPASTLSIKGDGANFRISSADYDLITMGPRGSSGTNLDKAFINLMSGDGSSKVYFDTASHSYINGGNLGIGTSSPAYALDVSGAVDVRLGSGLGTDVMIAGTNHGITRQSNSIKLYNNAKNAYFGVRDSATGFVQISGSDVGINTTSPQQPLHVLTSANDKGILIDVGDDTHEGRLLFGDTSSNAIGHIGYNHSLDAMRFFTNGAESLRLESDQDAVFYGNITLGEAKAIYFDSTDTSITTNTENPEDLFISADQDLFLRPDNDILVQAGTTTYAIFDGANERVGIGTTTPAAKLHIEGTSEQLRIAYDNNDPTKITINSDGDNTEVVGRHKFIQPAGRNFYLNGGSGENQFHVYDTSNGRYTSLGPSHLTLRNNSNATQTFLNGGSNSYFLNSVGIGTSSVTAGSILSIAGNVDFSNNVDIGNNLIATGSVGIGTTAPYQKLDIRGNLAVDNEINFDMDNNATAYGYINWDGYQGGDTQFRSLWIGDGRRQTQSSSPLAFFDGPTRTVGVGLTNPASFSDGFTVQLSSNSGWPIGFTNAAEDIKGAIRTDQADNYIAFASKSESDIRLFYNDTEANTALIVKGSGATAGNVGIGTTLPGQKLHVEGGIAVSGAESAGDSGYGHSIRLYNQSGSQTLRLYSDSRGVSGEKRQFIDASGRLSISSTENMGIGPSVSGEYLHLFSGDTSHMYLDAGNSFLFRDTDDSNAIRMRLASADGALGVAGLITASGGATIASSQNFTMGGQATNDILISSDASSTSDTVLVTAGYVNAHAGGGGGTIAGSLSDNYIPIGSAANTVSNFVLGLTENNGIWIGSDPSSVINTATGSVALGITALDSVTTGHGNTAIGRGAGTAINTGQYNTFVGHKAGEQATTSNYNNFFGNLAGYSGTRGNQNNAFGYYAMSINQGTNNVAMGHNAMEGEAGADNDESVGIGAYALRNISGTADMNTAVGYGAMQGAGTGITSAGQYNVAVGNRAMSGLTGGYSNAALGRDALRTITTGYSNVAIGHQAGYSISTGQNNVLVGNQAGFSGSTHNNTTFIGNSAGLKNTSNDNVAIGSEAYLSGSSATQIVAIGRSAGKGITTGQGVIAIGPNAAQENEDGTHNVAIGWQAMMGASGKADRNVGIGTSTLLDITTGESNVGVGYQAANNITTGDYNVAIGNNALAALTTYASNVAIGHNAGYSTNQADNVMIGSLAGYSSETSGSTLLGFQAGYYPHGNHNTFVGYKAGKGDNSGVHTAHNNVAVGREAFTAATSAEKNTILGTRAAAAITTQNASVYIGFETGLGQQAGSGGSVGIGHQALYSGTQNYQDTAIGINAGKKATGASANSVYIGSHAGPTSTGVIQNKLYINNAESDTPLIYGDFAGPSVTVNGALGVTGSLSVTGSTLAVKKEMKTDLGAASASETLSDSYSHYMATADNTATTTVTITCPASPEVGDEYFIVAKCMYSSVAPSNALVQITPNTGQTINQAVSAGSNIALNQLSSGTPPAGQPVLETFKTAHLICIDSNQWVLTISDVGPTS